MFALAIENLLLKQLVHHPSVDPNLKTVNEGVARMAHEMRTPLTLIKGNATALLLVGVGEALVSLLDEKGAPRIVERAFVVPPQSQIGPVTLDQRQKIISGSTFYGHYEKLVDRESAYEMLKERAQQDEPETEKVEPKSKATKRAGRQTDDMVTAVMKSAGRAMASQAGREITRGILGSLLGGTSRRR